MLTNLKEFFKFISLKAENNKNSIFLFLISYSFMSFSFGVGMLTQFYLQKPSIEIEKRRGNNNLFLFL